jgi:cytochrome c oxidase subunit II
VSIARGLAFLLLSAALAASAHPARGQEPHTIPITAKRFEFEPKEIRLKKGEPATLAVTSQDVTHGFFSRPLGFDEDIPPGKTIEISVSPKETGTYTIICDHYCGSGHGGMKLTVVVE